MNRTFGMKGPVWPEVDVPVGKKCTWCDETFIEHDLGIVLDGVPGTGSESTDYNFHKDCFLRSIYGSVGHQMKQCHCYGGDMEDPVSMTKREAAKAAVDFFEMHRKTFADPNCNPVKDAS